MLLYELIINIIMWILIIVNHKLILAMKYTSYLHEPPGGVQSGVQKWGTLFWETGSTGHLKIRHSQELTL